MFDEKTVRRFWVKVDVRGQSECWEWVGHRNYFGYGLLGVNWKTLRAHRLSWFIHYGNIPEGVFVLHRCDNPSCINPNHLFLGTKEDNTQDMMKKGRHVPPPFKILPVNIAKIIDRYARGGISQRELAEEYGVCQSYVSMIIRKKKRK